MLLTDRSLNTVSSDHSIWSEDTVLFPSTEYRPTGPGPGLQNTVQNTLDLDDVSHECRNSTEQGLARMGLGWITMDPGSDATSCAHAARMMVHHSMYSS